MSKPLVRWTCGPCLQQGLDILVESIQKTTKAFGHDRFDWMVCYNSLTRQNLDFLKSAIAGLSVALVAQNWVNCPIDEDCRTPRRIDGSFEWNGNKCGGSLWKVCPARARMESHEIVIDNDLIILRRLPQIDEFLKASDKVLLLEEPIRFYGRYEKLFSTTGPFLNSGLMGYPPGYDFGTCIKRVWEENGSLQNISQADEQGLLTYTLQRQPAVRIHANQVVEVLARDFSTKISGREDALHFTQSNRIGSHRGWVQYKKLIEQKLI